MGGRRDAPKMPCQFSPMPVPCIRPLMEAGVLTRQGAVLQLLLLHRFAGKGGKIWMSYPRERIADELGVTPESVRNAVKYLVDKGVIRTVVMGYKGKASVYELNPDLLQSKGVPGEPPNDSKGVPGAPKGGAGTPNRGCPEHPPTRTSKELVKTAAEGPALGGPGPAPGAEDAHVTRKPIVDPRATTITAEQWAAYLAASG